MMAFLAAPLSEPAGRQLAIIETKPDPIFAAAATAGQRDREGMRLLHGMQGYCFARSGFASWPEAANPSHGQRRMGDEVRGRQPTKPRRACHDCVEQAGPRQLDRCGWR